MKNKYAGFTLVECLVVLLLMSGLFLMLSGTFRQSSLIRERIEGREVLEWQIFLIQFDQIAEKGTFKNMNNTGLVFTRKELHEGRVVSMAIKHHSEKNYIYLSNNGGHEPILTQVKALKFEKQDESVLFTVTFLNGEKKIGKWTIP